MNQTSHAHLTVTKNELSEALFDQVGLNKREAKDMIDAFFDRIAESLETGTEVKISGFGNFQLRNILQYPFLVLHEILLPF